MKQFFKGFSIVGLVILVDQLSKLWVYSHMEMGENGQIALLDPFLKLTYVLNPGMAFSVDFSFKYGKLLLTLFRMIASCAIFLHLSLLLRQRSLALSTWGWIFVLGGAIGNSIDSLLYGVCLDNAPITAPMKWFHGQVIDMIHIDLWSGVVPSWLPIWGGVHVYCLPVFNIADLSIFVGLSCALYAHHRMRTQQPVVHD